MKPGAETWFIVANGIALAGWLVLLLAPSRTGLYIKLPQTVLPVVIAVMYGYLILGNVGRTDGGFGSIEAVRSLFANDAVLVAGWAHYLAFDLFVGSWIAQRADAMGLHRLVQVPILLLTLMFGPLGLLAFLALQTLLKSRNQPRGET